MLCEGVEVFGLVDGVGVGVLMVVVTTVTAVFVSHGWLASAAVFKMTMVWGVRVLNK